MYRLPSRSFGHPPKVYVQETEKRWSSQNVIPKEDYSEHGREGLTRAETKLRMGHSETLFWICTGYRLGTFVIHLRYPLHNQCKLIQNQETYGWNEWRSWRKLWSQYNIATERKFRECKRCGAVRSVSCRAVSCRAVPCVRAYTVKQCFEDDVQATKKRWSS